MNALAGRNAEIHRCYSMLRAMGSNVESACEAIGLEYKLAPSTIGNLISTTSDGSNLDKRGQIRAARAAAWPREK